MRLTTTLLGLALLVPALTATTKKVSNPPVYPSCLKPLNLHPGTNPLRTEEAPQLPQERSLRQARPERQMHPSQPRPLPRQLPTLMHPNYEQATLPLRPEMSLFTRFLHPTNRLLPRTCFLRRHREHPMCERRRDLRR